MDLRAPEYYAVSGLPVVGAQVDIWDAVLGTPAGSPLTSTTTDPNGWWTFTGLTDTPKDVRVTFAGYVRWYKGLTEANMFTVRSRSAAWYDPVFLVRL